MPARPTLGKFLARAAADEAEIFLYDQIGSDFFSGGITADQVRTAVAEAEKAGAKSLAIYIKSPGGDVFEGTAIYACLKRFAGPKTVYIDGMAASIASVIAMAGDRRCMSTGAMMMIHDPAAFPSSRGVGTAAQMREKATFLDKIADSMVDVYAAGTGKPPDAIRAQMKAETWMTAKDAVALGFATETFEQDGDPDAAAYFAKSPIFASFHNVPDFLRARAAIPPPPALPATQETHTMFKALLAKLGLSDSATEAQALVAFDAMVGTSRKLIEITAATTESEALGRVAAWKSSHEKVEELTARVQKIETEKAQAEVKTLVEGAIKDGKAAPAQRDSLLLMNPETLKAFVAAAPVIHGKSHIAPETKSDTVTLSAEEEEVCRKMNRDPKAFLEAKKKTISEGRAPHPSMLQALSAPVV